MTVAEGEAVAWRLQLQRTMQAMMEWTSTKRRNQFYQNIDMEAGETYLG